MFSIEKLKVETADGQNMTLLEAFTYTRKDGCVITVPKGSTSDGASTPPPMWGSLPPFGTYWKAAFLHDYLYRSSGAPKEFCDQTFLEAMETLGVDEVTRQMLYRGVAVFGWRAFKEDQEAARTKAGL
jgi:hypothetical protein